MEDSVGIVPGIPLCRVSLGSRRATDQMAGGGSAGSGAARPGRCRDPAPRPWSEARRRVRVEPCRSHSSPAWRRGVARLRSRLSSGAPETEAESKLFLGTPRSRPCRHACRNGGSRGGSRGCLGPTTSISAAPPTRYVSTPAATLHRPMPPACSKPRSSSTGGRARSNRNGADASKNARNRHAATWRRRQIGPVRTAYVP